MVPCKEIVLALYVAEVDAYSELVMLAALVPPPPPPPPPPEGVSVADYLESVSQWRRKELLPALEGSCSS